jgi:hypothetical protein
MMSDEASSTFEENMMIGTRYARVQPSVSPLRSVSGTVVGGLRNLRPRSIEDLFSERQRMMASAVREEERPGLFVFAAHERFGHLARLWLEASDAPRAGTVGRHDEVDLALPLDESLSLRHLLFIVRRAEGSIHFSALNLETPGGVQLESGQPVRLVESVGALFLRASEFVFFCIPTGQPVPWNPDDAQPWSTLLPRAESHVESPDEPVPGRPIGKLEVRGLAGARGFRLDAASLRRGVLVGRADRCEVRLPLDTISRVHAVMLQLGDEAFLVDAGSTNGIWRDERQVRIAQLVDGVTFDLGREVSLRWQAAH